MLKEPSETLSRLQLRIRPDEKAAIVRAATLEHMDLSHFVLRTVLPTAHAVIERAERVELSERDSLRILDLLEHPPPPEPEAIGSSASHAG